MNYRNKPVKALISSEKYIHNCSKKKFPKFLDVLRRFFFFPKLGI